MTTLPLASQIQNLLPVLKLFLIPVGGGIPAGVMLARANDLAWPITTGLYLISDIILALAFEPILRLLASLAWMSLITLCRQSAGRALVACMPVTG